jgi:hypothetical protein
MIKQPYKNKKHGLRIEIPNSPQSHKSHNKIQRCQTPKYIFTSPENHGCDRLMDWEIVDYCLENGNTGHYLIGLLPSGKLWETSDLKRIQLKSNKIKAVTHSGTKYELFLTDSHKGNTQHIFL